MLQEMVGYLLTPNAVSFSASISEGEKGKQWEGVHCCRRWEGALGLLQEMMQQLLTPNVVSWNAARSACEKGKQWDAIRLMHGACLSTRGMLAPLSVCFVLHRCS